MAPLKENTRAGPNAGRNIASKGNRCIQCGKEFAPDKEEDDAKIRFSKDETNRFINEEGNFSYGKHRRDQVCNDCFHAAVANDNELRAIRRSMDRAVKRIWKKIYLKEGDKVPWSEDEDEDDAVPSENVQPQTEKASSSSLSREKTCAHCRKVGNFDRCAKCKVTFYCSPSHQAADYAKHKVDCQAPTALMDDTAQPTTTIDAKPLDAPRVLPTTANLATREEYMSGGPGAGSKDAPNNNEQPPFATWLICAHCGIKSDKLSRCSRCKCTRYCSADHQRADYPEHNFSCWIIADAAKIAAQPPAVPTDLFHPHIMANKVVCLKNRETMPEESPVISWRELEGMHPYVAIGRTLEVRVYQSHQEDWDPVVRARMLKEWSD